MKKVTNGTAVTTTDYISGYQYSNAVLKFFPTSEGYVNFDAGVYKYVFNYLDHLGNIRLSYTKDVNGINGIAVIEENHYYPYGLKHTNYNVDVLRLRGATTAPTNSAVNKYKFNGQEYQDELSLNLYDMDMRDYDPAIARWTGIDPVVHFSQSTYNAFDGNPVFWADPSGADSSGGSYTVQNGMSGEGVTKNFFDRSVGGRGSSRSLNMTNGVRWNSHWGDGPAGSTWYHYDGNAVSLLLAPLFDAKGNVKNDYGTGALALIINAAIEIGGTIRVLHVNDTADAANQISDLSLTIGNVFILSHGDSKNADADGKVHNAYFAIGGEKFNNVTQISDSKQLSNLANAIASNSSGGGINVLLTACGAGGLYNGGAALMSALSSKLGATVFGNQSLTRASSDIFGGGATSFSSSNWPAGHDRNGAYSNSYDSRGAWTMANSFGVQTVNNITLDSSGNIRFNSGFFIKH